MPAQRCNLRKLANPLAGERGPPPITAGRLLALLSQGQMITIIWPNRTSMLIKGKHGSRRAIAATSRRVEFLIANTTQAELLTAALRAPYHGRETAKRLLTMLSLAASIPDDGQDDQRFAERLAAWELGRQRQ